VTRNPRTNEFVAGFRIEMEHGLRSRPHPFEECQERARLSIKHQLC